MQKKASIFHKFSYFINSIFALLLLLAYALPFVKPSILGEFAGVSLLTPLLILVNILFVVYWLLRMKRTVFLSLLVLGLGFTNISRFYKFSGKKIMLTDDVKIMSYNVRMFNKYNWIKDDSIPAKINAFIYEKAPDIICFQEYSPNPDIKLDYKYKYEVYSKESKRFGHAIFSKFPIIAKGNLDFKNTANTIMYADVLIDKDTLRIYNTHLQSLRINPKDEDINQENANRLRLRVGKAFVAQQRQVTALLAHQKEVKHKVIIAGDFNNTAFSWPYRTLLKNKKDAFVAAGKGFDKTYDFGFPMRIDFILVDKAIAINHFITYRNKYSDHYPILTRLDRESLTK